MMDIYLYFIMVVLVKNLFRNLSKHLKDKKKNEGYFNFFFF